MKWEGKRKMEGIGKEKAKGKIGLDVIAVVVMDGWKCEEKGKGQM